MAGSRPAMTRAPAAEHRRCRATASLVSGQQRLVLMEPTLQGLWWPPEPLRGGRRPPSLRPQPWMSIGTAAVVAHDRTVAWPTTAWTRQVTVTKIFCGVDVSSEKLDARIGH